MKGRYIESHLAKTFDFWSRKELLRMLLDVAGSVCEKVKGKKEGKGQARWGWSVIFLAMLLLTM
jgi:hypothetical protein